MIGFGSTEPYAKVLRGSELGRISAPKSLLMARVIPGLFGHR
jgi:hypothetical protein